MSHVKGIDISAYQGRWDWDAWRDKIGFAGIRATTWTGWGTFTPDPFLAENAAGTWGAFNGKLPRFYYHETRPGLHDAHVQARLVLDMIGGHLCRGDALYAAMEESDGENPAFLADWHNRFLQEWSRLAPGHRVLAYCNPSWAQSGACAGLDAWPLWIADYGVTAPTVPAPWSAWTFWQWSGTTLDRDWFNGTVAELQDWLRMPSWRR